MPSSYQLPTSLVQQYQNQQLPGLSTGTGATAFEQTGAPTLSNFAASKPRPVGVAKMAHGTNVRVQDQSKKMMQQAQKAAAQARTTRNTGNVGGKSYNGTPVGQAWKADGTLSNTRNAVLGEASKYLGSRYVLGGTTQKGIDCSGLVMAVYNKFGYNVSRHSAGWQGANIPGVRTSVNNLRPGDIVAWKDGSHIAIYAGNGQIIEAANERVGTVRRKLWASPSQVFGIALRLPGE